MATKTEEMNNPDSCLNSAHKNEIIFVLRAADDSAPDTIRNWCFRRMKFGQNNPGDPKIQEAWSIAQAMDDQRKGLIQ